MEIFGTVHVWIASEQIANDLMAKRGSIYSDRPTIPNLPDNRTSGDYLPLLGRNGMFSIIKISRIYVKMELNAHELQKHGNVKGNLPIILCRALKTPLNIHTPQ